MIFPTKKFRYCNIQQLTNEGMDTTLSNEQIIERIEEASKLINRITDQWFYPIETTFKFREMRSSVLTLPNFIPIIELNKLIVEESELDIDEFNSDIINDVNNISQRIIESYNGDFSGKIEATGVFGYIERKEKIETVTSGIISSGTTNVNVINANGFQKNDVLIFVDGNNKLKVICNSVDKDTNKLYFGDVDINDVEISSGAKVYRYGQIPTLINKACKILVLRNLYLLSSDEIEEQDITSRLISETTDKYSYKLSSDSESSSGLSTGITYVDNLLLEFMPPPLIRGV